MLRSLLCFSLVVAACTNNSAPSETPPVQTRRSLNSGFGTLLSVQPVRVQEGFTVWRQGREITVHEGLLIKVDGVDSAQFHQGAATTPMFVLDDSIGLGLAHPSDGGSKQAVILTHSPPAGTQATLWLTSRGTLPTRLSGAALRNEQQRAFSATTQNGLNLQVPPDSVARKDYPTLEDLRLAASEFKVSKQFCANIGVQCGVFVGLQMGHVDCGGCPDGQSCGTANLCCSVDICQSTGRRCGPPPVKGCEGLSCGTCPRDQVCTDEGSCCQPGTCESLGQRCGRVSNGCGGTLDCGFCPAAKKK